MASFTKRGKTWQYSINRLLNGERKPITKGGFNTKKEAQIAAAEIEDKLRKGVTPHLKLEPFDEYFQSWLEIFKPNINKNTKARYYNTYETLKTHFAGVPIQHITKRTYQAFLNQYGQNRAHETVRKFNTHIRACIKDAIDEGVIFTDFTRGVSITGAADSKRNEDKYLNYADSQRLIQEITQNLNNNVTSYYIILLGLTSGMRFAEMVGLTGDDFDFNTNQIRVKKTWGYTNKMHSGFGPTKNPQSIRTIKMDQQTMNIFREYINNLPNNEYGLVFYSSNSKYKVISNNAVNKTLEHILNKLNISPISIHGLRHTHASILLYQGISIYYVSERLGHGDIETTMSYYAHIIRELRERDENNSINVFEKMLV